MRATQMLNTRGGWLPHPRYHSGGSHRCRSEASESAGNGAEEDSEMSKRPAVTDAQRREALRLPPLPIRPEQLPQGRGTPPEGDSEREQGVLERTVIYLGGCLSRNSTCRSVGLTALNYLEPESGSNLGQLHHWDVLPYLPYTFLCNIPFMYHVAQLDRHTCAVSIFK